MENKKIKKKLTLSISGKKTHSVSHYAQSRGKTSVVIEKKTARKWSGKKSQPHDNIFNKSKRLIKLHNISIIERNCSPNVGQASHQIYNKSYYLKPEFNYYIRERNNILLIYRLIVNNYMNR